MYITKLALIGYKRLMLSLINHFEYTPNQPIQLIIGSNGSGKSSVLDELTPVPAHHSGFVKGGKKIIECTHRGRSYILTSTYDSGTGKHSFIRIIDTIKEELNPGGTFMIQKELVEKEFGLTRELHELFTGVTSFSSLPTNKRRELLTKMSPVDLGYAFSVYNKVKTSQRDQQAIIKHLTKRMVSEQQNTNVDCEKDKLLTEINGLTEKLNVLLQLRKNDGRLKFNTLSQLEGVITSIVERGKQLLTKEPKTKVPCSFKSKEEFEEILRGVQLEVLIKKETLERTITEYDSIGTNLTLENDVIDEEYFNRLKIQLGAIEEQLKNIVFSFDNTAFPQISIPLDQQPEVYLKGVVDEWLDIIRSMPDNSDGYYSIAKSTDVKKRITEIKNALSMYENKLLTSKGRLSRLKGCDTVICPSCTHQFKPGVDPAEINKLEEEISVLNTERMEAEKELEQLVKYSGEFDDYISYVKRFKRLTETTDVSFKPVWDVCIEKKIMVTKPTLYLNDIHEWWYNMSEFLKFQKIKKEADVLEQKLKYIEILDPTTIQQINKRKQLLEEKITEQTQDVTDAVALEKELIQYKQQLTLYFENLNKTITTLNEVLDAVKNDVEVHYQYAISEEIKNSQLLMAQMQSQITAIEMRDQLLADIKRQYDEACRIYELESVILKALSPTEGIIGRYLVGFMQNVVKLINAVIDEVWTYPLVVLPSGIENDELDYRFPVNVNDGAVVPPDISRCSSSQTDIIDFAFKLLVMRFLDLHDIPLYLDEFGNTFDEQHRLNLIPFISNMVDMNQIEQVFFISHFATMHSAFNQAEILVIDPSNITTPTVYNQHVKMH